MAFFSVLSCVLFSLCGVVWGNVPVLLWESSESNRINPFPALHRVNKNEFQQYMLKKVGLRGEQQLVPLVVLFSEESLSLEDLSWKDSEKRGNYPQVEYIYEHSDNQEFLPSVRDPIESIKGLSKFGLSVLSLSPDKIAELPDGCGKILDIKLDEAKPEEDRPQLLRRHDEQIAEMYSQLLSKCSHVIALVSAPVSSWMEPEEVIRLRRSIDENATSVSGPYTLYQDTKGFALLYSSSLPKIIHEEKEVAIGNYTVLVTGDNSKPTDIKMFAKYGTDVRLTFNFDNKTYGYWTLRSVGLEVPSTPEIVLTSSLDIEAPLAKSFHSGTPVVFKNGSTTVTFSDLQVQPFFLNPGSVKFSDAIDAVEFFTPAIWSGIFVTFLLAIIFTWGISMIMDIRTMDQFDDPKGKTITVSATD